MLLRRDVTQKGRRLEETSIRRDVTEKRRRLERKCKRCQVDPPELLCFTTETTRLKVR